MLLVVFGVTTLWAIAALGFLNALQIRMDVRQTQYDRLIHKLTSSLSLQSQLSDIAGRFRGQPRELMPELVKTFIGALSREDRGKTQQHTDVVRALVLLISEDL